MLFPPLAMVNTAGPFSVPPEAVQATQDRHLAPGRERLLGPESDLDHRCATASRTMRG